MVCDNGDSLIYFVWLSNHFTILQQLQNHNQGHITIAKEKTAWIKCFKYCCQMFNNRTCSRIFVKPPFCISFTCKVYFEKWVRKCYTWFDSSPVPFTLNFYILRYMWCELGDRQVRCSRCLCMNILALIWITISLRLLLRFNCFIFHLCVQTHIALVLCNKLLVFCLTKTFDTKPSLFISVYSLILRCFLWKVHSL